MTNVEENIRELLAIRRQIFDALTDDLDDYCPNNKEDALRQATQLTHAYVTDRLYFVLDK